MIGLPASTFGSSVIEGCSAVMGIGVSLGSEADYLKTPPDAMLGPYVLDLSSILMRCGDQHKTEQTHSPRRTLKSTNGLPTRMSSARTALPAMPRWRPMKRARLKPRIGPKRSSPT